MTAEAYKRKLRHKIRGRAAGENKSCGVRIGACAADLHGIVGKERSNMYRWELMLISFLAAIWVLVLAWIVLCVVADWKIFKKAGQPGWASIVPLYSDYIGYKIYWGNGWIFLLPLVLGLLTGIPILGAAAGIAALVIRAMTSYKKSVAFGQGIGFAIGLFFLPAIFSMILAFGNYRYRGIPQDGFSYQQMKGKYDSFRAKEQTYTYETPNTSRNADSTGGRFTGGEYTGEQEASSAPQEREVRGDREADR